MTPMLTTSPDCRDTKWRKLGLAGRIHPFWYRASSLLRASVYLFVYRVILPGFWGASGTGLAYTKVVLAFLLFVLRIGCPSSQQASMVRSPEETTLAQCLGPFVSLPSRSSEGKGKDRHGFIVRCSPTILN